MSNEIIQLRLYRIFRKMGINRTELNLKTNLLYDLCFDEFDMNIFLFFLESRFDIEIKNNETQELKTINNTLYYLRSKINAA